MGKKSTIRYVNHCLNLIIDGGIDKGVSLKMSQLIQILHSPFWGAAIVTIILLNAGDYKWRLIALFGLFAIFGKICIKNNEKEAP